MAWTNVETLVIGGVTYIHQRGDQITDLGHRLTADGTPGDAAPLNRLAQSGDIRAALPEFDLANQSGLLTTGIFNAGLASALTAGRVDLVVVNVNLLIRDGAVVGAGMALGIAGPSAYPVVQSVTFADTAGLNPTTAGFIDVGGGTTVAQAAAKLKAAVDLGLLVTGALVTTAIATTNVANDTVRVTAAALGAPNSPRAWSLSDGLTITQTTGT